MEQYYYFNNVKYIVVKLSKGHYRPMTIEQWKAHVEPEFSMYYTLNL